LVLLAFVVVAELAAAVLLKRRDDLQPARRERHVGADAEAVVGDALVRLADLVAAERGALVVLQQLRLEEAQLAPERARGGDHAPALPEADAEAGGGRPVLLRRVGDQPLGRPDVPGAEAAAAHLVGPAARAPAEGEAAGALLGAGQARGGQLARERGGVRE